MKVVCEREALLTAYQLAASVAPSRGPKPVLCNVKFDAGEQCTLAATDLELGVSSNVHGVTVESPGTVLLPIDRFGPVLKESRDTTIRLSVEKSNLIVRGDRSEYRLPVESPSDFPSVVSSMPEAGFSISAERLRQSIRRTVFCTDSASSRYALGGVLIEVSGKEVTAVGTDGRRLAVMVVEAVEVDGDYSHGDCVVVPVRALQAIDKTLGDASGVVSVAARSNDILVQCDGVLFHSRLIEGRFPKWRDVVPGSRPSTQAVIAAGPLLSAVRQAQITTSAESKGVTFSFDDGKLSLAAIAADRGQSYVELPVEFSGKAAVSLDPKFVADFLRVLEPETLVTMDVLCSDAPVVCSVEGGYRYVIMPLSMS